MDPISELPCAIDWTPECMGPIDSVGPMECADIYSLPAIECDGPMKCETVALIMLECIGSELIGT